MPPDRSSLLDGPIPRRHLLFCAASSLTGVAVAERRLDVVYPRTNERPADGYVFKLLQAALMASGRSHTLRMSDTPLPLMRAFAELSSRRVNVIDAGAAPKAAEQAASFPFRSTWG